MQICLKLINWLNEIAWVEKVDREDERVQKQAPGTPTLKVDTGGETARRRNSQSGGGKRGRDGIMKASQDGRSIY